MKAIGTRDKLTLRNDAGFSAYPAKHYFRCLEEVVFTNPGTLKDAESGISIAFSANDIAATAGFATTAGSLLNTGVQTGSTYAFADTEDIVLFLHHNANFTAHRLCIGNITIGNTSQGGMSIMGTADGTPGVILTLSAIASIAVVIDRSAGTAKVYDFPTSSTAATPAYTLSGVTGSFSGTRISTEAIAADPRLSTAGGLLIAGFASGELPSTIEDDLELLNATHWAGNRVLPNGWGRYY